MKMKKIIVSAALVMFFMVGKLQAQTVYMTETGKKYHAKNCDLAKTGKKGLTLEEAKKKGLEPCKACKVESISSAADKTKVTSKEKAKK